MHHPSRLVKPPVIAATPSCQRVEDGRGPRARASPTPGLALLALCLACAPARRPAAAPHATAHAVAHAVVAAPADTVRADDGTVLIAWTVGGSAAGRDARADTLVVPLGIHLAADLAPLARGRVVLFYDPRGRGRSAAVRDPERLGFDRDVADLEAVRRHYRLSRFDLLGWSNFGAVAALYTAAHPDRVRRLVLLAPIAPRSAPYPGARGTEPDSAGSARAEAGVAALRRAGLPARDGAAFCRAVRAASGPLEFGPAWRRLRADPCAAPNEWPDTLLATQSAIMGRTIPYDWTTRVARIRVPTLVVGGTRDFAPPAAFRDWARRTCARLVLLPGVGHGPHVEAPGKTFDHVSRFLAPGDDRSPDPCPSASTRPPALEATATPDA